jgi:hypothetical protein
MKILVNRRRGFAAWSGPWDSPGFIIIIGGIVFTLVRT